MIVCLDNSLDILAPKLDFKAHKLDFKVLKMVIMIPSQLCFEDSLCKHQVLMLTEDEDKLKHFYQLPITWPRPLSLPNSPQSPHQSPRSLAGLVELVRSKTSHSSQGARCVMLHDQRTINHRKIMNQMLMNAAL